MEITPQHLGKRWRKELLKRRSVRRVQSCLRSSQGGDGDYGIHGARKRPHRLARKWVRSAGLSESDAQDVAVAVSSEVVGFSWQSLFRQGLGFGALLFLACFAWYAYTEATRNYGDYQSRDWVIFASFSLPIVWMIGHAVLRAVVSPRRALRGINTDAVTAAEIEAFLPTARGELDRTYLNTVLEAIRQPVPSTAGQDIRTALRAVGDSVSAIPGMPLKQGSDDPMVLRSSAHEKRRHADAESDSLAQTSLRRQAEVEEQQAQILEYSGAAAKRARARHDETAGHIDTLRTVLTVYASPENAAGLEQGAVLQDAVRRVAGEAVSTSAAKRELEDSELATLYGAPLPEPQLQKVGKQSTGKAPQSAGKWWQ